VVFIKFTTKIGASCKTLYALFNIQGSYLNRARRIIVTSFANATQASFKTSKHNGGRMLMTGSKPVIYLRWTEALWTRRWLFAHFHFFKCLSTSLYDL